MDKKPHTVDWLKSRWALVVLGFVVITGFFLVTEHRAHFFGYLPFLLLLLCPLLHWVLHGGHGGHGGSQQHSQRGENE